jgi:GTP cyclohydrolase I
MNVDRKELIAELLKTLGEDPAREGLRETPRRVDEAWGHLFSGYGKKPEDVLTVFANEGYDEMVLVKDIEFYSHCEHHLQPFFGKAHIAYIPREKIVGLSKLPRVVEIFARRLQNQERLTTQIADSLQQLLDPKGVAVVLEAKHLCMMARGVEKQHSEVTTSTLKGLFKERPATREEFLRLIGR